MKTTTSVRLGALAALFVPIASDQATAQSRLFVDAAVSSSGDGSTWGKAMKTLGAALAAARSGTEVWVATGRYAGGFTIPAGVAVYGGFANGDARLTERDIGDQAVELDGGGSQRVLAMAPGSTVDGCFIIDGRAGAPGGAGLLVIGAAVTVRNCGFLDNNITGGRGSAVYLGRDTNGRGANPLFENCLFVNNGMKTTRGHVIDVEGSSGTPMFMAIGVRPLAAPFFLPQLGTVLVDLSVGAVYPWAAVDTPVPVTIPMGTPIGSAVLLQGAAGLGAWGNLSNPLDLRVRR